jgi:3'-phosphoadenosine 5'-phosphosulfate sulfotransferase (PAPS reductase)/FAD synthetase
MDVKQLQERQKWTLEQKIDHAVGTIEAFIARTGKTPYVSFSGGKDSTVVLDLARRFVDPSIKAVFCNTGNEYPEIVDFVNTWENVTVITPKKSVRSVISKYGFPLLSKETAHSIRQAKTTKSVKLLKIRLFGTNPNKRMTSGKIADKWQYLIHEPFMISEQCCDILKKRPFAKYQKETGEVPILGVLATESRIRQQAYVKRGGCNSFRKNHLASYPLSIWTDEDIWAYIRKFNVPYCKLYKSQRCNRTGCMFCGFGAQLEKESRFSFLYELHPNFYKVFMNYENNGVTYREALRKIGVYLPDEDRQLKLPFFEEELENL